MTSRCKCCNHHIWVQESVEKEMGPVCRERKMQRVYLSAVEDIKRALRLKGITVR